jgi:hypothetical protein
MKTRLFVATTALLLCQIFAQRSYTLNSINSTVIVSSCSATVSEVFELNFNGVFTTFSRAIQDYTTSTQSQANIVQYSVVALTSNVQVVATTITRPSSATTNLNVQFSSPLSSVGLTRFQFDYTIINFVSTNIGSNQNTFIWNSKWQLPVPAISTYITISPPTNETNIDVISSNPATIQKQNSRVSHTFVL